MLGNLWDMVQLIGKTSIEVYEWKEADVRLKRLQNTPDFQQLTTALPNLSFSGWSLAHAVVKADYLDERNLTVPGLGFLLQTGNLLSFGASPIQLKAGASKVLNDVSSTSLSGRVAQGLAILYAQQALGLQFTAHLSSHVAAQPAGSVAASHLGEAMADFLFTDGKDTVLVEAKGSFTLAMNDPTNIKSKLKTALTNQIDPWLGHLAPTPKNGYVVYACLREPTWQNSALSVVDPPGEAPPREELPPEDPPRISASPEDVVRRNYAAWLNVMGMPRAAQRLMGLQEDQGRPAEQEFLVLTDGSRDFAFPLNRVLTHHGIYGMDTALAGIELNVLRAISKTIQNGHASLNDLISALPATSGNEEPSFSIFPDGTAFGPVDMPTKNIEVLSF